MKHVHLYEKTYHGHNKQRVAYTKFKKCEFEPKKLILQPMVFLIAKFSFGFSEEKYLSLLDKTVVQIL